MSAKVRFFTGDLFVTAGASDTAVAKLYEKDTSKNYYFKTADKSKQDNKTYYVFKPQSTAVTNHADGNIYVGIDTTTGASSMFVDKADTNGTITTYRVGLEQTLLVDATRYAAQADADGAGDNIRSTYLKDVTGSYNGTNGKITLTRTTGNGGTSTSDIAISSANGDTFGLVDNQAQTWKGNKTLSGNTSIGGTLDVTGATTLSNTLTVDGNYKTALGGALDVTGTTTLKSTLSVDSTSTFTGKATFNGKLESASDANSAYSKDAAASIVTAGGISVANQLSAKTVRIDDNAATAGHGCIMQYNSAQACLEFTFA